VTRPLWSAAVTATMCGAALVAACGRHDPATAAAELATLRAEVRELGDSATSRFREDGLFPVGDDSVSTLGVGVRVETLREILSGAAAHYLDDVRLHLRLDVLLRAGDDVRVRVGPATVTAGRWDLAVTVQRGDALLRAGVIDVMAGDSNRLDLLVPVHVRNASGRAMIDFTWNARRLASVVCSDFAISEPFNGFVRPHTHNMRGYFVIATEGGRMVARPVLRDRIFVSPQPTEESWHRVREILREQDRIFRCGLALSPERMEEMLRDLLTRGFRFSLPSSILRPVPLPGSVLNEVEVAGRRVALAVTPDVPRITRDRLWLRASVQASALDDTPIRIDTP
jgi:hypothetical protein